MKIHHREITITNRITDGEQKNLQLHARKNVREYECVCVCLWEREFECVFAYVWERVYVCVLVSVCFRERERERERERVCVYSLEMANLCVCISDAEICAKVYFLKSLLRLWQRWGYFHNLSPIVQCVPLRITLVTLKQRNYPEFWGP